ncbi:MAG: IS3 family transposase [Acidobacteria bacterium]|nr:IS3 family transposase [Acidobacteriota bacterium]
MPVEAKRALVDPTEPRLSQRRQCALLGIARSGLYYQPAPPTAETVAVLHALDALYTAYPFYGSRRMVASLRALGYAVNRKRVQRLMQQLGVAAIYPGPRTTVPQPGQQVYPYLLRGLTVTAVNQVWSTDITYIRLRGGFIYLTAVLDWASRYVLAWEVSNTLDGGFCLSALERALRVATPQIFNTDQGVQFTCQAFTGRLQQAGVQISMDGRGRALDNIFVERFWRSIKYEEVYLKDYTSMADAVTGLRAYFQFYNAERLHQALAYRTPSAVYWERDSDNVT